MSESERPALSTEALQRRLERERRARKEAEELLHSKSRELYQANQALQAMSDTLTHRVGDLESERARVLHIGRTDSLTGLSNRGAFTTALAEAIHDADERGDCVALYIVDLDRFKEVNDTLGHHAGDMLLQTVGHRLLEVTRLGEDRMADTVARLGGDEFAVIAPMRKGTADIRPVADRLVESLLAPHNLYGREMVTGGSVGVAIYPNDAADAVDLQRFADMALYRAKSLGRGVWVQFDAALRKESEERRALEEDLRIAVAQGGVAPWFQPVMDVTTGRFSSLEVLARWNHPVHGMIGPDKFVPVAEELGLIAKLDAGILDQACKIAAPWVAEGLIDSIACNVSPRELMDPQFADLLIERLKATALPPQALVVEITETFLVQDLGLARRHIDRLAECGVRVALDDFGTGYSNLRALMQLPIDTLKIDRSLTLDMGRDPRVTRLVRLLAQTTRALGVNLIAEGVEDQAQAAALRAIGCTKMQGYLFARPMPAHAVDGVLRRGREAIRATA